MSEQRSKADNTSWQGFSTKAVHAGYEPDPLTGAVNVPIYASSTFAQDGVGGMRSGFEYARTGNPTRRPLEANLAAIESGTYGRAFSSGMAATDCLLRSALRPGDHLVIPNDAYGGTYRLIDKVFTQWGIEYSVAAVSDVDEVRSAMRPTSSIIAASCAPLTPCATTWSASACKTGCAGGGALSSACSASCHHVSRICPTNGSRVVRRICPSVSSSEKSAASPGRAVSAA